MINNKPIYFSYLRFFLHFTTVYTRVIQNYLQKKLRLEYWRMGSQQLSITEQVRENTYMLTFVRQVQVEVLFGLELVLVHL